MGTFLILLGVHWFADFVLQTDWQAKNKSTNGEALMRHVLCYTFVFSLAVDVCYPSISWSVWTSFVLLNGVLHYATDYLTSRLNSRLWASGNTHNFFVSVGFDQYVHQLTIAGTMWLYFGWGC